ncbi:hypothetical protein SDC9_182055 [bioreactor metagenome]|uniref:Uncharacterized protein n=1 Tax=bioreactor metagenome TaxID=1076179 RepID=A0A645H6B6_9ZZZZ
MAFCCAFSWEIFLLRASSSTARAIAFEANSLLNRSWRAGRRGPTAARRWRAKCIRATRASFWAMILSVPCSSAIRRRETDGEKRTKLSRPSHETAKNFCTPFSIRNGGLTSPFSRPGARPNITETGTICTSRSGLLRCKSR